MASIPLQFRQRQAQMQFLKRQILTLLEWDEMTFAKFQYRCGCSYLQHYIPNDPEGIDMLIREQLYWNWWKNRWADRDELFLLVKFEVGVNIVKDYKRVHNAEELAKEIRPSKVVLSDSYAQMMGELIHTKTQKP